MPFAFCVRPIRERSGIEKVGQRNDWRNALGSPDVPTTVPCDATKQRLQSQREPSPSIGEVVETLGFARKVRFRRAGFSFGKPPYAALWKSSIWRIQLVSGFHLGQIWATNLRSSFTRRLPSLMNELRLASHAKDVHRSRRAKVDGQATRGRCPTVRSSTTSTRSGFPSTPPTLRLPL